MDGPWSVLEATNELTLKKIYTGKYMSKQRYKKSEWATEQCLMLTAMEVTV